MGNDKWGRKGTLVIARNMFSSVGRFPYEPVEVTEDSAKYEPGFMLPDGEQVYDTPLQLRRVESKRLERAGKPPKECWNTLNVIVEIGPNGQEVQKLYYHGGQKAYFPERFTSLKADGTRVELVYNHEEEWWYPVGEGIKA